MTADAWPTMVMVAGAMPGEARAWTLMGILAMALGMLVMLMGLTLAVMLRRRRRRLLAGKAETATSREVDPWAEAGRRTAPPSAQELEGDADQGPDPSR